MIEENIKDAVQLHEALLSDAKFLGAVQEAAEAVKKALVSGHKLLIAGNGGSAADAQHMAAEFVATLRKEKRRGYPALALNTDTSFLTAWVNDFGVAEMFSRQVEALGAKGDVFIGISTSGNSENILRASEKAKEMGLGVVGLLGSGGGRIASAADVPLIVPSSVTSRIQEVHTLVIHLICEEVVPHLS